VVCCEVRGCGDTAADHHDAHIRGAEGDAGSNHHFRTAKHRVFDTLLGQTKLRITLERWCGVTVSMEASHGGGEERRRCRGTISMMDVELAVILNAMLCLI